MQINEIDQLPNNPALIKLKNANWVANNSEDHGYSEEVSSEND